MARFLARKAACNSGHTHASGAEAKRCNDLHTRQALGEIACLRIEPRFPLHVGGRDVKMGNGQVARYTADFTYIENSQQIVEDVKPFKKGRALSQSRDFPLRFAFARACYPDIDFRVVK